MKKIAVMTSGGDAPGMNAALRSLVRVLISEYWEVFGVYRAYDGLIDDSMLSLTNHHVSNIIQLGGTILKTSRSERFLTRTGMKKAASHLKKRNIDAMIVLGGNGTMRGLNAFQEYWQGQVIGIPATIDNDLFGTDETIGYDSAVNIAVRAIDNIRDTAGSHEKNFIVEVMGRSSGHIALSVGISVGAEEIIIPEKHWSLENIVSNMKSFLKQGKSSQIVIITEKKEGSASMELARSLKDSYNIDYKISVLGHIQRGGSPTAKDRILASKLAAFSIDVLKRGETGVMVGEIKRELVSNPLEKVFSKKKLCSDFLYDLSKILR